MAVVITVVTYCTPADALPPEALEGWLPAVVENVELDSVATGVWTAVAEAVSVVTATAVVVIIALVADEMLGAALEVVEVLTVVDTDRADVGKAASVAVSVLVATA